MGMKRVEQQLGRWLVSAILAQSDQAIVAQKLTTEDGYDLCLCCLMPVSWERELAAFLDSKGFCLEDEMNKLQIDGEKEE